MRSMHGATSSGLLITTVWVPAVRFASTVRVPQQVGQPANWMSAGATPDTTTVARRGPLAPGSRNQIVSCQLPDDGRFTSVNVSEPAEPPPQLPTPLTYAPPEAAGSALTVADPLRTTEAASASTVTAGGEGGAGMPPESAFPEEDDEDEE
jgi:hypothetical protein